MSTKRERGRHLHPSELTWFKAERYRLLEDSSIGFKAAALAHRLWLWRATHDKDRSQPVVSLKELSPDYRFLRSQRTSIELKWIMDDPIAATHRWRMRHLPKPGSISAVIHHTRLTRSVRGSSGMPTVTRDYFSPNFSLLRPVFSVDLDAPDEQILSEIKTQLIAIRAAMRIDGTGRIGSLVNRAIENGVIPLLDLEIFALYSGAKSTPERHPTSHGSIPKELLADLIFPTKLPEIRDSRIRAAMRSRDTVLSDQMLFSELRRLSAL